MFDRESVCRIFSILCNLHLEELNIFLVVADRLVLLFNVPENFFIVSLVSTWRIIADFISRRILVCASIFFCEGSLL